MALLCRRRWRVFLLAVSPLVACGGTTRSTPTGGGSDHATGGGGAGAATGGAGGAATGGGRSSGGAGGKKAPACMNPAPVLSADGRDTGFVSCNGAVHRVKQVICPSPVPRPDACVPGCSGSFCNDGCTHDADCTARPVGYCYHPQNVGFGGAPGCYCDYGCLSDADCGDGMLCQCGDPVGHCQLARDCRIDSDCGDHLCLRSDGCPSEFACQSDTDDCVTSADCGDPSLECNAANTGGKAHLCGPRSCPIP